MVVPAATASGASAGFRMLVPMTSMGPPETCRFGCRLRSVACTAAVTVKSAPTTALLEAVPPGVLTTKRRAPTVAVALTWMEMGKLVAVPPGRMLALTPAPEKPTSSAPVRLVPVMTASKVVPWVPEWTSIPVMVGTGMAPVTVKLTAPGLLAVPPGVVTVKDFGPATAVGPAVTVMLTVVAVKEVTTAVTAGSPNATAVAPARLVPWMTAATGAPPAATAAGPGRPVIAGDGTTGAAGREARSLAAGRAV